MMYVEGQSDDDDRATYDRRVRFFAMCASINSVSLGLVIGIVAVTSKMVKDDLNLSGVEISFYQAAPSFFSIFGAAAVSFFMDPCGRRAAFVVSSILFLAGLAISATASKFVELAIGASILGFACGMGNAIDPLYIAELSPRAKRGHFVTYAEIGITLGGLLAAIVGLIVALLRPNAGGKNWRVVVAVAASSPLSLLLAVFFVLPESPRWLAVNGMEREARAVLRDSLGLSPKHVDAILDDVKTDTSLETLLPGGGPHSAAGQLRGYDDDAYVHPWVTVLCHATPATRRIVFVAVGVAAAQQLSGIDPFAYQFVFALNGVGVTSDAVATSCLVVLGTIKLIIACVAAKFIDVAGRRPLLVSSASTSCFFLSLIALSFAFAAPTARREDAFVCTFVALSAFYIGCFEIGLGPGCWLIPSEILYNKIRLPAMGFATLTNRLVCTCLVAVSYSLHAWLGWSGFYGVYAFTCALAVAFLAYYLPETRGISLEEMYDFFDALVQNELPGWLSLVVSPAPDVYGRPYSADGSSSHHHPDDDADPSTPLVGNKHSSSSSGSSTRRVSGGGGTFSALWATS